MSKHRGNPPRIPRPGPAIVPVGPPRVKSLLGLMEDGNEYGSIVGVLPEDGVDVMSEVRAAIKDVEAIRERPCVCYVANVIGKADEVRRDIAISTFDHLPFNEMIELIEPDIKKIDVFLVTPGGLASEVIQFVNALRPRFDEVDFLLPYMCMSAGTLWALSGDRIWMDSRASIGPIDPQIVTKDGRPIPAQALMGLIEEIGRRGEEAQSRGAPIPWHLITVLTSMDEKEVSNALSSSNYVRTLAAEYLESFKFRSWTKDSAGSPITSETRKQRAEDVAAKLSDHGRWKAHGHAINRDVAWKELRIRIDHPESIPGLRRAMRRLWALLHWAFDHTAIVRLQLSQKYCVAKLVPQQQ